MEEPLTLRFKIDVDDACFKGHFPGFPVYPAVQQLSRLAETVSLMRGSPCTISAIPTAKFLHPVVPGSTLSVEVTPEGENSAAFKIHCGNETVAKGKLNYKVLAL
jgi:3-hydroxyacyl-[acyl-carrier-protein] dehydratase